jgi:hypothetical protein
MQENSTHNEKYIISVSLAFISCKAPEMEIPQYQFSFFSSMSQIWLDWFKSSAAEMSQNLPTMKKWLGATERLF